MFSQSVDQIVLCKCAVTAWWWAETSATHQWDGKVINYVTNLNIIILAAILIFQIKKEENALHEYFTKFSKYEKL